MPNQPPEDARPERDLTDESLAVERAKADDALNEQAAVERKADVVIERAREDADEVLAAARANADQALEYPGSAERTQAAINKVRDYEDHLLRANRARADDALRAERAANALALARLLPIERDRTDQHLLIERARADDALANRDDFLGMVSHDLRDLLQGIALNAAYIADHTRDDEHGKLSLVGAERIQRSAGRMSRLIGDLVDIASIDAGKLAIVATDGDAASLVVEAIETWAAPALAKGITLEAAALKPLRAKFDRERILQVLGNLITNAVKFSPKAGAVVVGVDQVDGFVRFSVKDRGIGIAADKLEVIFERFWQVGKNDRRGLGLGLYISHCLVHAHGGTIWVDSVPGAGSTFYFTVPIA